MFCCSFLCRYGQIINVSAFVPLSLSLWADKERMCFRLNLSLSSWADKERMCFCLSLSLSLWADKERKCLRFFLFVFL